MKKLFMSVALLLLAVTSFAQTPGYEFTTVVSHKATPVKDQGSTGTCWCFATASFMESELLRMGKGEYDLSEMFIVRQKYMNQIEDNYLRRGKGSIGEGSLAHTFKNAYKKAGIVPEEVYTGLLNDSKDHNHGALSRYLKALVDANIASKKRTPEYDALINNLFDIYLGKLPEKFTYKGKEYTPQSFTESLGLNMDDYIELTSFTHKPYYETFSPEVPDNWENQPMYNLPLDELIGAIDYALNKGYTVCWDGDVEAMHKAVDELANKETFHGYGPEQGYDFLIDAVIRNDYAPRGVYLEPGEVFISDGAKSDTGNIGDILRHDNSIGVTDPIYPVYIDSNVMCGRAGILEDGRWSNVVYLPCLSENNFVPEIPDRRIDILYLCYPNNPTGTVISKAELKKWVNYALENDTLILYDAAYEAYIQDPDIPHSIYEIKGAKKVAIEFRSFSKTAGFTGVRCGYTVVPKELTAATLEGERIPLNRMWNRRQCTKFNGTSYITQRGAEAIYTPEGKKQVKAIIQYYMANARIMKEALESTGLKVFGGENAPYLWVKTPGEVNSWKFFEQMLYEANVVGTPGVGFGPSGEGYIRLTAFGERADCEEAMKRIRKWLL